ncbi:MAG: FtsH protease activity modulator HflK [Pseudomonadota bacterium]
MPWQNNNNDNGGPWQNGGGKRGGGKNPWGGGPRSGGSGGAGGPDLDDLIRRSQQRLKGAVPGGVGGGGILLVLLLLGLVWIGFTSWYTVKPGEQGIILRFGEYVRTEGTGFHLKLPAPIETALTPNVERQNRIDVGFRSNVNGSADYSRFDNEALMLTGDENIVDVAFTVFWRIADAQKFLFNIQEPQEQTVKDVAESAMREVIGRRPIRDALTDARNQIQIEVQTIIQNSLNEYGAGISIQEVALEQTTPPEAVIDAFRDVQAAEADKERSINEAKAFANDIVPRARGEALKMLQEAEAYKESTVAGATGEADRFNQVYDEYRQAKDVTRKRIYLETMEDIMQDMNKVIIDGSGGSGVVPYLPLPDAMPVKTIGSLIFIGILTFIASLSLFTLQETRQAIVLQFGNPVKTYVDPGLKFKMPWQNVVFLDSRVLSLDVPPEEVTTSDQKRLVVDAFARFQIKDALKLYQRVFNENGARDFLSTPIRSQLREVLGKQTFTTLLSAERSDLMEQIRSGANVAAQDLGIELVDVRIKRADLPKANSEAIYRRMNTEREQEAREIRAEGEEEKLRIEAEANKERTVMLAKAEQQSQTVRGDGDAQAIKIFAEAFERDEEFFGFYRSMQAYRKSLNSSDTSLVLSPSSEFFEYFDLQSGK